MYFHVMFLRVFTCKLQRLLHWICWVLAIWQLCTSTLCPDYDIIAILARTNILRGQIIHGYHGQLIPKHDLLLSSFRESAADGVRTNSETSVPSYLPEPNPYILPLLKCPHTPNLITNHVRLTNVILHNISLVVPSSHSSKDRNGDTEQVSKSSYFNPALIPLPSWSRHQYVLVSRLVTPGLHQESHICLADICVPPTQSPTSPTPNTATEGNYESGFVRPRPQSARLCTQAEASLLGQHGGLICVNEPKPLSILPTPAYKCQGSWSAFPHIPGFHDPRVFWSGKGEPLVQVNSGSSYKGGCLGLWVIDLRSIYPEMEDDFTHTQTLFSDVYAGDKVLPDNVDGRNQVSHRNYEDGLRQRHGEQNPESTNRKRRMQPKMSYPYLTEITRNPVNSRRAVEKNWILFFPKGEEAWVQYDLLDRKGHDHVTLGADEAVQTVHKKETDAKITLPKPKLDIENDPPEVLSSMQQPEAGFLNQSFTNEMTASFLASSISNVEPSGYMSTRFDSLGSADTNNDPWCQNVDQSQMAPDGQGVSPSDDRPSIHAARSLAKIIGHGYTTPNMTTQSEIPCLNASHLLDSRGERGHWHQGSNSLRLVLCHRANASCHRSSSSSTDRRNRMHIDDLLVTEGKVMHLAVFHRKFSNALDLPMRYERYIALWEARYPFLMVGITRFPILFAGERAWPWSPEENWHGNGANDKVNIEEKKKWENVYFTYTPSLAWAWRREELLYNLGEDHNHHEVHSNLGTGYLDDELLVGVGMDDVTQGVAIVKVEDLASCLRLCPRLEVR